MNVEVELKWNPSKINSKQDGSVLTQITTLLVVRSRLEGLEAIVPSQSFCIHSLNFESLISILPGPKL